ncbi:MAG TPA: sarcosine oxidase subunit delta [Enteractinococcus helveticum]|uniref:Sarcosine oxidase subunit delta n=1 Tax=Enteractinococcus helveticum TaxID=1837282 RepID=A0A921FM11_9MICC|nr:sarcosine oxidase subunit delta [Enteractinococcus helveticum]HJF13412.1 sarcosine oxidase subunit delta [Enteractinococcus helveticum]
MMQINCPWCGLRNATEFKQYGERPPRPDVANATREQWADYLYFRDNAWGVVKEQWFHSAGCRQFFMLHRDTFANKAIRSEGDVR